MLYPTIPVMTPLSPADALVPFTWDFSNVLAPGDTIASIVGMTVTPAGLTVGGGAVVPGIKGASLAVQASLGPGTSGTPYTVTAEVITAAGSTFARSLIVPIVER